VLETVADMQLNYWVEKKKTKNYVPGAGGHSKEEQMQEQLRKKFYRNCIDGEWSKCRHPNLLHEIEFWFGIACMSMDFGTPLSVLAFVGPSLLTMFLVKTAIPITEKVMKDKRADYWTEYIQTYPQILPKSFSLF